MISMFATAWIACSSPGYEIFGMGGSSKLGGSPMQPRLQSPTAKTVPSDQTPPPSVGFLVTCMYLLKWIQPPPPGPFSLRVSFGMKKLEALTPMQTYSLSALLGNSILSQNSWDF